MKRYLVMCKDNQQWSEYVRTHEVCIKQSNIFTIDIRDNSFIITDNHGEQYTYVKVIPESKYRDNLPTFYKVFAEKIWLCTKEEYLNLAMVDKYF